LLFWKKLQWEDVWRMAITANKTLVTERRRLLRMYAIKLPSLFLSLYFCSAFYSRPGLCFNNRGRTILSTIIVPYTGRLPPASISGKREKILTFLWEPHDFRVLQNSSVPVLIWKEQCPWCVSSYKSRIVIDEVYDSTRSVVQSPCHWWSQPSASPHPDSCATLRAKRVEFQTRSGWSCAS